MTIGSWWWRIVRRSNGRSGHGCNTYGHSGGRGCYGWIQMMMRRSWKWWTREHIETGQCTAAVVVIGVGAKIVICWTTITAAGSGMILFKDWMLNRGWCRNNGLVIQGWPNTSGMRLHSSLIVTIPNRCWWWTSSFSTFSSVFLYGTIFVRICHACSTTEDGTTIVLMILDWCRRVTGREWWQTGVTIIVTPRSKRMMQMYVRCGGWIMTIIDRFIRVPSYGCRHFMVLASVVVVRF